MGKAIICNGRWQNLQVNECNFIYDTMLRKWKCTLAKINLVGGLSCMGTPQCEFNALNICGLKKWIWLFRA